MDKKPQASNIQSKKGHMSSTKSDSLTKHAASNSGNKLLKDLVETTSWHGGRCGKLLGTAIVISVFGCGVWFSIHLSDVQTAIAGVSSAILGDDLNEAVKSVLSSDTDKDSKVDVNKESQNGKRLYAKSGLTNAADMTIHELLDRAESAFDEGQENAASVQFDDILKMYPKSPRAIYGKTRVLHAMAEKQRNSNLLDKCIETCRSILTAPDVPKELLVIASKFCAERFSFRGRQNEALDTLRRALDVYPDEIDLLTQFAKMGLIARKVEDARSALQKALKVDPENGFAMVLLGFILASVDQKFEAAIPLLQKGIESNAPGVIDERHFLALGDTLYKSGRHDEARSVYRSGAERKLFLSEWQRSLYNVDGLTARPWWTLEQTGQAKELNMIAEHWKEIRDEGLSNWNKEGLFVYESGRIVEHGEWKQLKLYRQGRQIAENCRRAPLTCSVIQHMKEATGCTRGQIYFSVMQPGIHVWPHCGTTNCRLRAHLGLVVPEGLRIRVVNETRTWKEGEFIVFDDSFEHEVWHDGDSMRLVLIVDMWHPEVSAEEKRTLIPV